MVVRLLQVELTQKFFWDKDGKPLKFFEAVVGGLSVGVPGTPALMEVAQKRWGNQTVEFPFHGCDLYCRDRF